MVDIFFNKKNWITRKIVLIYITDLIGCLIGTIVAITIFIVGIKTLAGYYRTIGLREFIGLSFFILISLVFLIVLPMVFFQTLRVLKQKGIRDHQIAKGLLRYGSIKNMELMIGSELEDKHERYNKTYHVTKSWVAHITSRNLTVLKLDDIVWMCFAVHKDSFEGDNYFMKIISRYDEHMILFPSNKTLEIVDTQPHNALHKIYALISPAITHNPGKRGYTSIIARDHLFSPEALGYRSFGGSWIRDMALYIIRNHPWIAVDFKLLSDYQWRHQRDAIMHQVELSKREYFLKNLLNL